MIVKGLVESGMKRGTAEFVPTLNLLLEQNPVGVDYGVYACKAKVLEHWYKGVMHYGPRTTVDNLITFEVNLFDFDKQVYGEQVEVEILDFIRGIVKFDSFDLLKKQIDNDIEMAHKILNR